MQQQEPKRVLAVVSDLFFSVKLADAAKRAGLALEFVKESQEVLAKAKQRPSLIVFDLNFEAAQPLKLIAKLKGDSETKGISLLGYLSHVQGELKHAGPRGRMQHGAGAIAVLAEHAPDFQAARGVKRARASTLPRAAPVSMDTAATATPSRNVDTLPAATRAAAALARTMSR